MEPLVDVMRGVRDDGTGPAAQRGRPGGIAEWGPISAFSDARMSVAPDGVPQPGSVSQDLFFGESSGTVALPPIPEPVYPHVSAHTSHTSSCLSTLKTGKRQNSRFSDLSPRQSRTQPACASNELKKTRHSTIGRSDNSVITSPRENSWGVTHEVESVPKIAFENNTGETSGGSLVQRQKNALMVPNPRENSRRGRASRETSGRLADMGKISPRVVSVRSNIGETPDSRPLQRQKNALMVPNPRENSRRGRASRETSGRLADMGKISPRVVSVRSNIGETPGSRPLQRQKDALMIPNPRENSWGGARFQRDFGKASGYEKYFTRNSLCRIACWRDPR